MSSQSFKELVMNEEVTSEPVEVLDSLKEAIDTTTTTLAPTALEKSILELTLQGTPIAQIAYQLGIPQSHVRTFIRNPKVKEYIKEVKEAMNEIDQMMLTGTLRKILTDRVDELDEDSTFANLSNKDTLDIIRAFSDITNHISKNQEKNQEINVFTAIYQQILDK